MIYSKLIDPKKIKLRQINENDTKILYQMLDKFMKNKLANVHDNHMPSFQESKRFVERFLYNNKEHEISKWYIIYDAHDILGTIYLTKKNYIVTHILPIFQHKGIGTSAVKKLLKLNPHKTYFMIINNKHKFSIEHAKKLGFKPKAILYEKSFH